MIQFKRGKTKTWFDNKEPLAAGQPGYNTELNKLKIGNGEASWAELPYVGGVSADEILAPESEAKERFKKLDAIFNSFKKLVGIDTSKDKVALITYGTENPDKNTVGQLYLQYYDAAPETDYVIEYGINNGWTYQKWQSGIAKCWGIFELTTTVQKKFDNEVLYYSNKVFKDIQYPFALKTQNGLLPYESATLQSAGELVWLASCGKNTDKASGSYKVISPISITDSKTFYIMLSIAGRWK